jgi:hypothetical protein
VVCFDDLRVAWELRGNRTREDDMTPRVFARSLVSEIM